jgi:hypothetical protein
LAVVRPRDPRGGGVTRLVRVPALQASWVAGKVVLWAGNALATPANREDLRRLVAEAGGSAVNWKEHKGAPLPTGGRAPAVAAPPSEALGWLVGVGAGQLALDAGPSVRWLGEVAAWATNLVAQGRMVPTLRRGGSAIVRGRQRTGTYVVRWIAAVVDRERIRELSARMPGPVRATEVAHDLRRWTSPVVDDGDVGLIVRLAPPEADGGWVLTVDATGLERQPLPVERAVTASGAKAQRVETQLRRLERLVPALRRTGHRGNVVLGVDEAWDLMARTGRVLQCAGFDVRVPAASWTHPPPRLRLEATGPVGPAPVGPNQLSRVRWSVLFEDLELTERRGSTELSGAAILRYGTGLEESPLAGPAVVAGTGWAVELVRGAAVEPPAPLGPPQGFVGKLRS